MTILVVGAGGQVGRELVLRAHGRELIGLDRQALDITDHDAVEHAMHEYEAELVINAAAYTSVDQAKTNVEQAFAVNRDAVEILACASAQAAETGTGQSMYQVDHYVETNIRGTSLLLDHLAHHPHSVRRVVVASSRSIYGEGKYRGPSGDVYPGMRNADDMRRGQFECLCAVNRCRSWRQTKHRKPIRVPSMASPSWFRNNWS